MVEEKKKCASHFHVTTSRINLICFAIRVKKILLKIFFLLLMINAIGDFSAISFLRTSEGKN